MDVIHPLKTAIEPDPLTGCRFRWTIREGDRVELRSPRSYQTRGEAEEVAEIALRKRVIAWPGALRTQAE
jgi:hypothetical protein